jgi:hypothetical protein
MANDNVDGDGVPLALKVIFGMIVTAGIVAGTIVAVNYFKEKKAKAPDGKTDTGGKDTSSQNTAPDGALKTATGGKDYTGLANGHTVYATSPLSRGDLKLGQVAKVRGGATVQRMDQGLAKQGTTTLTADTDLGTIWHLGFPSTAVIRAGAGFDYPFYLVSYGDINQSGSLIDKGLAEIEKIL